jgi:hypothetical protein
MTNIAKTRVFETYPRISANTLQRLKKNMKVIDPKKLDVHTIKLQDVTIPSEFIHLRILCNSVRTMPLIMLTITSP